MKQWAILWLVVALVLVGVVVACAPPPEEEAPPPAQPSITDSIRMVDKYEQGSRIWSNFNS